MTGRNLAPMPDRMSLMGCLSSEKGDFSLYVMLSSSPFCTATLDDILALNIENILDRRLQTLVYQLNMADLLSILLCYFGTHICVVVEESESKFIFKFETDGSLKAADVLSYVLQRLEKRFTSSLI